MKWFYDLKVGTKLIMAFIAVSVITATVGFIGMRNMSKINDMADIMYQRELLGVAYIKEANVDLLYIARAERNLLLDSSVAEREQRVEHMNKYTKLMMDNFAKAKPLFISDKGKELFAKAMQAWEEYEKVHKQIITLALNEKLQEKRGSVDLAQGLGREKMDILDNVMTELTKIKEENAKDASNETTDIYKASRALMIGLTLGGITLGMFLGFFISRLISVPLRKGVEFTQAVANGDLTQKDRPGQKR